MRCTQPGCVGQIEDGYCNVCGMAASSAPSAPLPPPSATGAPGAPAAPTAAGSTRTRPTSSRQLASAPLGSARGSTSVRTRRLSGATSRRVSRIGAGITSVPSTAVTSPLDAVMKVAEVAEEKRFCATCNSPVGRSRDGKPGRTEGFCPKCGTKFSFTPKLQPGDLVGGQYEVAGCLAHGGLGWIYLARDKNVSDRFVVLKGLLNSGDKDAYEAAIAERQFLAEVQHPLIVEIYNFVIHDGAGYTVMEYVGGRSLKQILKARQQANNGTIDPLPVDQAAAYLIEVLPALQYLHTMGLLYCDFKPDNVIQEGDALKLIDLGGVRRIDDTTSAIYGTVGFQAPEVATLGPSVPSDVFTVARTLAVMSLDFRGYQSTYAAELPPLEDVALFQRHDSLYRYLLKGTAPDPNDRFQSADEMREQLTGVLREIVAVDRPSHANTTLAATPSAIFGDPTIATAALSWTDLPQLRPDLGDPATAWLSAVSIADPAARLAELDGYAEQTREVSLAAIQASIEAGDLDGAHRRINAVLDSDPWEWRAIWYAGLAGLATADAHGAVSSFNAVYGAVPGELAPKLALAHACELAGTTGTAVRLYEVCAHTDAAYVAPACFGVARVEALEGNLPAALDALDRIPTTSRAYVEARRTRIELQLGATTDPGILAGVADEVDRLGLDPRDRSQVRTRVFGAALAATAQGATGAQIGGVPMEERSLRLAIEHELRQQAKLVEDRAERIRLIDEANAVRPRTLV